MTSYTIVIFMDDPDYQRTFDYDWKRLKKNNDSFVENNNKGKLFKSGIFVTITVQQPSGPKVVYDELRKLLLEKTSSGVSFETELKNLDENTECSFEKLRYLCNINKIDIESEVNKDTLEEFITTLKTMNTPNHFNLNLGLTILSIYCISESNTTPTTPIDFDTITCDNIYVIMKNIAKTNNLVELPKKYLRLDTLVSKISKNINDYFEQDNFVVSFIICTEFFNNTIDSYYNDFSKMITEKTGITNNHFIKTIYNKLYNSYCQEYVFDSTINFAIQVLVTTDKTLYSNIITPLNDLVEFYKQYDEQ